MFPSTDLVWINWAKESVVLLKYGGIGYVAHGCNTQSEIEVDNWKIKPVVCQLPIKLG